MLAAWSLFALVGILMFVIGIRLAIFGLHLAIWMVSTKAGWITAGILFVAYLLFW